VKGVPPRARTAKLEALEVPLSLPFATVTFSLFAAVLGLNTTKKIQDEPLGGLEPRIEVTGDGTELSEALEMGTLGLTVMDSDGLLLRAPGPVAPSELVSGTVSFSAPVTLDTDPNHHVFDVTLQPTESDGSPIGGPVVLALTVNGGPLSVPAGDGVLTAELVADPTGDLLEMELLTTAEYPSRLVSLDTPALSSSTGANALSVGPQFVYGQTAYIEARVEPGPPPPVPGDLVVAEVDVAGVVSMLEAAVTEEVARVTRVKLSSTGAVEVDLLAAAPDAVVDVVVSVEAADGSDAAEAFATTSRIDTNFAILLDGAALLVPPPTLTRAGKRGVDMVVRSLDGGGGALQSQLVTAPVLVTPVEMERQYLGDLRDGDLGRAWDFAQPTTIRVDVQVNYGDPLSTQLDWGGGTFGATFGEILIDGVVWELE
jgi:hypothetical protein